MKRVNYWIKNNELDLGKDVAFYSALSGIKGIVFENKNEATSRKKKFGLIFTSDEEFNVAIKASIDHLVICDTKLEKKKQYNRKIKAFKDIQV